jgi:hypothetical protein
MLKQKRRHQSWKREPALMNRCGKHGAGKSERRRVRLQEPLDVPFGVEFPQTPVDAGRVHGKKPDAVIRRPLNALVYFVGRVPRHTLYSIGYNVSSKSAGRVT